MPKKFIDGFDKTARVKAQGNPAMPQCHKIIIISGYGFWGLEANDRDGIGLCHELMTNHMTENKKIPRCRVS
jgi:hypothetical protein